jgi:uncharacterized protein YgiM (DUF1202 family)
MRPIVPLLFAFFATVAPSVIAQVVVEKDTDLRAEASHSAPLVGKVAKGTSGEVIDKKNPWAQVKAPTATGWLFIFDLRFPSSSSGGGSGAGDTLSRLAGPRTNVSVTSTLGTRGLDKETLGMGVFDAEQIQLLDGYAATKDVAQEAARAAGLEPAQVGSLGAK